MKIALFAVFLSVVGNVYLYNKVTELNKDLIQIQANETDTIKNLEVLKDMLVVSQEMSIDRAHAIQDAVEERIGTLERDVNDLQYIFGKHKK